MSSLEIQAGTQFPIALRVTQDGQPVNLSGSTVQAILVRQSASRTVTGSIVNAADGRALIVITAAMSRNWRPGDAVQIRLQRTATGAEPTALGVVTARIV